MAAILPPPSVAPAPIFALDPSKETDDAELGKPPWESLPPELLVIIFNHLDDQDKESAETTCQLWHDACQTPSLWQTQQFYFKGDNSIQLVHQGCRTIERKGSFIRHITVKIGYPSLPQAWLLSQCVQQLLDFISRHPSVKNIETFKVNKLNFFTHWRFFTLSRRNILVALNNFLTCQKNLQVVDLTSCRLSADDGMRILRGLHISLSRHSIKRLDLHEFFQRKYSATSGSRFTYLITSSFHRLEELGVDAKHIDDAFLVTLTEKSAAKLTLRKLKIYFEIFKCPKSCVTERCWAGVRKACPALNVTFTFCGWLPFQGVKKILVPSVPLTECTILWPRVYRQQYDRHNDLAETISRLTQNYSNILERFCLCSDIRCYRELETTILTLASACRCLTEFKVTLRLAHDVITQLKERLRHRTPAVKFRLVQKKFSNDALPRLRPRNNGTRHPIILTPAPQ